MWLWGAYELKALSSMSWAFILSLGELSREPYLALENSKEPEWIPEGRQQKLTALDILEASGTTTNRTGFLYRWPNPIL